MKEPVVSCLSQVRVRMTSHRWDPSDCTPPAKLARLRNEVIVPRSPITRYRLDADRLP
eukprot:jgi/Botrbrau1/21463/Bobra.0216s0071.1